MATKKPGTAVIDWKEEMQRRAKLAQGMAESMATGSWFSLKSGVLSFNDEPLPNNQMAVIVLAAALENVYYEADYDPDTPSSPTCFAVEPASPQAIKQIAPHALVVEAGRSQTGEGGTCATCPKNQFGSADKGRGKACSNKMRLTLIPAGRLDANGKFTREKSLEHFTTAQLAKLRVPTMSVPEYNGFVKRVVGVHGVGPEGVFAQIKVVPDAKSQFRVTFKELDLVPDEVLALTMPRLSEAEAAIADAGYSTAEEAPKPVKSAARGRATSVAAKSAAPAGRAARY